MESDSSDDYLAMKKKQKVSKQVCPYLGTVNRFLLDFDFEKVCSVTLSNAHVYACLVCGKYFSGRGKGTPAYTHSIETDHHVFIHLSDERAYCLPENYEISDEDSSLSDIRANLNPRYTSSDVSKLPSSALSLTGAVYLPGLVGFNPIRDSSYMSAVLHLLCSVVPLRDFLLTVKHPETAATQRSSLLHGYSELMRKVCNRESFKGVVSPQEFLHVISELSNNRFNWSWNDPIEFFDWMVNTLYGELVYLPGTTNIVTSLFGNRGSWSIHLDLPPVAVFRQDNSKSSKGYIPTINLIDLCADNEVFGRYMSVSSWPSYIVIKLNRFVMNDFFVEKNKTIVTFPLTGFRFASSDGSSMEDDVDHSPPAYSLVGVICHEQSNNEANGDPMCINKARSAKDFGGSFKSYVLYPQTHCWYECSGLRVAKVLAQSVAVVESYILLWKKDEPSSVA